MNIEELCSFAGLQTAFSNTIDTMTNLQVDELRDRWGHACSMLPIYTSKYLQYRCLHKMYYSDHIPFLKKTFKGFKGLRWLPPQRIYQLLQPHSV